jgi:hypothetical protein
VRGSILGKTPEIAVSEKSGAGRGDSGLRGLPDGRFRADHHPEKINVLGWKQMVIYFQPPDGQKLNSG